MSKSKITVSGLALLLAKLQAVDIQAMARAVNLPRENVNSWLAGNRSCLRVNSIVSLMALLGLRLDAGVWRLDAERVHFWQLTLGMFTRAEQALAPLTILSRMLGGTAITQIRPPNSGMHGFWRMDYYMIGNERCRVVVAIRQPFFRRARVTPDVVKGALWRDDNRHHLMPVPATHWAHVRSRDLTAKEFDLAFNESLGAMVWADLGLAARQYNLTPEDLMGWIRERHEPAEPSPRNAGAETEVDIPPGVFLLETGRRTGTFG